MSANTGVDTQDVPVHELVDLVRKRLNRGPVVAIETRPNGFSTKVASTFVTLYLEGGEPLALFVKKVRGAPGSHRPDPIDREAQVYAAFSGHPGFAAPELVGIIGTGDPHLVLLAVPGLDLRYQDLDHWALAAEELGAMHAEFASKAKKLESYDFLARHDAPSNLATARHASAALSGEHSDAARRIQAVVEGYERVAVELTQEPPTLVHGDLAPKNVVIEDGDSKKRAVFVDWEWAGIGPGLGDLADLVNGLDRPTTLRMLDKYVAAAAPAAVPADRSAVARSFKLALLHKTMFRLGRSIDWGVSDDLITEWAGLASGLYTELT